MNRLFCRKATVRHPVASFACMVQIPKMPQNLQRVATGAMKKMESPVSGGLLRPSTLIPGTTAVDCRSYWD